MKVAFRVCSFSSTSYGKLWKTLVLAETKKVNENGIGKPFFRTLTSTGDATQDLHSHHLGGLLADTLQWLIISCCLLVTSDPTEIQVTKVGGRTNTKKIGSQCVVSLSQAQLKKNMTGGEQQQNS